MTGPEHYHKAEQLLAQYGDCHAVPERADKLAAAHVHATLALAAATAAAGRMWPDTADAWDTATGVKR